jgi:hypothetical protein
MTRLEDIPTTTSAPQHARPSSVVAHLRSLRPSRRVILRGMLVSAAAAALVPLDWFLARRAMAVPLREQAVDDTRSEYTSCEPADYTEERNNWWSSGAAVCYGGWRRGSFPCADGFHREGSFAARDENYVSTRLTTNCHGRNAWRWHGFRCSDAMTTATFDDGTEYSGVTIAACAVGDGGIIESDRSGDPSSPQRGLLPAIASPLEPLEPLGGAAGSVLER